MITIDKPLSKYSKTLLVLFADAECLQRAVEGRAASDEEEEDRGLSEAKKHISRLHSCGKGLVYIHHTHNHPNIICFPPTTSHVTLFTDVRAMCSNILPRRANGKIKTSSAL